MALDRQLNIKGQMRIDVPHLRSIESGIAHDFDVLAGSLLAGRQAIVIKGFAIIPPTGTVAATALQMSVAGSIVTHYGASEAGSLFAVPDDRAIETLSATNTRVSGGFVANATNYVGIDIVRSEDSSTSDIVEFLDANTLTETPKTIPLGRTADYKIVISSTAFSANGNIAPVAVITTNAQNQVSNTSIKDARNLMFRLGTGGDNPNKAAVYSWPGGRVEGQLYDTATGDKAIASEKDWKNAVMHRIWELGGGDTWYAPSSAASLRLVKDPTSVFGTTSDNFEFVSSNLHWRGLTVVFDNSPGAWKNTIADQLTDSAGKTNIVAGECIYVDLDRTSSATVTAQKATLQSLGAATTPGARMVIAWCTATGVIYTRDFPMQVGASFISAAGTGANGSVRIATAAPVPANPVVPAMDSNNVVVATGISRTSTGGTSLANGALSVGTGAADTSMTVGQSAAALTVNALSSTFARIITISSGGLTVTAGGITVNAGGANITGGLTVATGTLTAPTIDYAGAMSIGGTNGTSMTIGRTGQTVTMPGSLTVTQNATVTGTLYNAAHDTASAVAMNIGATNANAINISKSAILTKVLGTFESVQDATFDTKIKVDTIDPKTGAGTIAVTSNVSVTGSVTASANVTANTAYADAIMSRAAAGPMTIGTTTQTGAVTISRSGQTTTVGGNLTVSGNLTVTGTQTFSSTVTLAAASGAGLDAAGKKITNLPAPTAGSTDAATAAYAETKRDEAINSANTTSSGAWTTFRTKFGSAWWDGTNNHGQNGLAIAKVGGQTGVYRVSGPQCIPGAVATVTLISVPNEHDTIQIVKATWDAMQAGSQNTFDFYMKGVSGGPVDRSCNVMVIAPF